MLWPNSPPCSGWRVPSYIARVEFCVEFGGDVHSRIAVTITIFDGLGLTLGALKTKFLILFSRGSSREVAGSAVAGGRTDDRGTEGRWTDGVTYTIRWSRIKGSKLRINPNLSNPLPLANLGILNCYFLLYIWAPGTMICILRLTYFFSS